MIDTSSDITTAIKCRDGQMVVTRTQQTEPYLDRNKTEMHCAPNWRPYASSKRSMYKVAEIPNIIAEQWMREGINVFSNDPDQVRKVRAKLDSNEYAYLRTFPGKLGERKRFL